MAETDLLLLEVRRACASLRIAHASGEPSPGMFSVRARMREGSAGETIGLVFARPSMARKRMRNFILCREMVFVGGKGWVVFSLLMEEYLRFYTSFSPYDSCVSVSDGDDLLPRQLFFS